MCLKSFCWHLDLPSSFAQAGVIYGNIEHCFLHVFYWSNKPYKACDPSICPNPKTLRIVLRFGGCPNPHKSYFIDVYSVWASRKMIMILFYDIRGMALSVFLLKFQDTRL